VFDGDANGLRLQQAADDDPAGHGQDQEDERSDQELASHGPSARDVVGTRSDLARASRHLLLELRDVVDGFKWKALGLEYQLGDVESPSPEAVDRTCAVFRDAGLRAY